MPSPPSGPLHGPGDKIEPPPRRDFVAMGKATRAHIVQTAFDLILELGYDGVTTTLVQRKAGVSRGSLLNQFPTRADLMVAVSEHIIGTRSAAYTERYRDLTDDRQRWDRLIDVLWDEFQKPGGLARLEITAAAASDLELRRKLAPSIARQDKRYRDLIWAIAERLGARDRAMIDTAVTTYSAALRGLAIDLLYPRPGVDFDAAVAAVKRLHALLLEDALEQARRG